MEEKLDLSVVILHYNDLEMTKAYIENLKRQNWADISHHFLIVDNASPDGSGVHLKELYADDPDTVILCSEENLGFPRGNNLGILYAVSQFSSNLIIVSNNDIVIEDSSFMQKLVALYVREKPDVLGPDIYSTRKGIHQSPIRSRHLNEKELQNKIRKIDKTLWKLRIIDRIKVYDLISKIKRAIGKHHQNATHYEMAQEGAVVHGAFFILTEGYLRAYPDGLFPDTFLYMEEDIINYRVRKCGLKALYDPSLSVVHLDGVSSLKEANGNRCKKFIFELEQTKLSCQSMLMYIESERRSNLTKSTNHN